MSLLPFVMASKVTVTLLLAPESSTAQDVDFKNSVYTIYVYNNDYVCKQRYKVVTNRPQDVCWDANETYQT